MGPEVRAVPLCRWPEDQNSWFKDYLWKSNSSATMPHHAFFNASSFFRAGCKNFRNTLLNNEKPRTLLRGFSTHFLNCFVGVTTPNDKRLADWGFWSCHQCWGHGCILDSEWRKVVLNGWAAARSHKRWVFMFSGLSLGFKRLASGLARRFFCAGVGIEPARRKGRQAERERFRASLGAIFVCRLIRTTAG